MSYVYSICSASECSIDLIQIILIAKYVYYEKINKSKKWWIIFGSIYTLVNLILEALNFEDQQTGVLLGASCLIIILSRKKNRIKGLFLIIPIIGIILSLFIIIFLIITILTHSSLSSALYNELYSFIESLITLFIIIAYVKVQKNGSLSVLGILI